jgi:hypothetical protein
MTHVTLDLPDDLAEQAKDAGLLATQPLVALIRKALQEQGTVAPGAIEPGQQRRLVRNKNGYLVVAALPGEKPITNEEVRRILDDMEW